MTMSLRANQIANRVYDHEGRESDLIIDLLRETKVIIDGKSYRLIDIDDETAKLRPYGGIMKILGSTKTVPVDRLQANLDTNIGVVNNLPLRGTSLRGDELIEPSNINNGYVSIKQVIDAFFSIGEIIREPTQEIETDLQ